MRSLFPPSLPEEKCCVGKETTSIKKEEEAAGGVPKPGHIASAVAVRAAVGMDCTQSIPLGGAV